MIKKILLFLTIFSLCFLCSCSAVAIEQEKPIFSFELSDTCGLLNVEINDQTYQEPHDFVLEIDSSRFVVQTMPYDNKHSIEIGRIDVYDNRIKFTWKLVDGAHEKFVSATACNKEHDEATTFNIENSDIVYIPYYKGLNNYDLYCYTGQTVGIIEFDLFDVISLYVEDL
jgi:hypothetical protein